MEQFKSLEEYVQSLPEDHQNAIKNYNKIRLRYYKYGENIVKSKGRKPVSIEHKKEVQKAYYKRKSEEAKARKIAEGTYKGRGRPRKND